jgi:hypothetical protein
MNSRSPMVKLEYQHRQAAHCESGTISALLRHGGLDISEPMAFGLSGALSFAYVPVIKIGGMPLISYRMPPGYVVKGLARRLGLKIKFARFRDPVAGMQALRSHLELGRPVGMQTSVFWLPYFPPDMRFHFNAHNLVAYGFEDERYYISDPTFESPMEADGRALQKARFVKGALAPRGLLYYPVDLPATIDHRSAVEGALRQTLRVMLGAPLPIIGVKGIRHISKKVRRLGRGADSGGSQGKLFLGHMVRMQEEIGTGGGGFRFLFGSFLQEAGKLLQSTGLGEVANDFTDVGDEWRRFALYTAKMIKGRMEFNYEVLADQLQQIARLEESAFLRLKGLQLR